jgi:hypothetical protein
MKPNVKPVRALAVAQLVEGRGASGIPVLATPKSIRASAPPVEVLEFAALAVVKASGRETDIVLKVFQNNDGTRSKA